VEQRLVTGPTLAGDHAYNTKSNQLAQSYDSSYVGFRVSIITDPFELIHNGISDASKILMRKEKFSTLWCGVLCTRKAWMHAHDANAASSFFPFFCVFCINAAPGQTGLDVFPHTTCRGILPCWNVELGCLTVYCNSNHRRFWQQLFWHHNISCFMKRSY
jgi:hypothetical protein